MEKSLLESYLKKGMSLNQIAKKSGKCLTTIRYWTLKHQLKSNFEAFQKKEYGGCRLCPGCNRNVPTINFYSRRGVPNSSTYCKKCTAEKTKERQKFFKRQCVEYKGGKCEHCGYSRCMAALEFHHLNPNKKDFNVSHLKSYLFDEVVKTELDKCSLLCACCHREEHSK